MFRPGFKAWVVVVSFLFVASANAAIIHKDWKTSGDRLVSVDTVEQKEWLKLSATVGETWTYVNNNLSSVYSGWRLPTRHEVKSMTDNLIGPGYVLPGFPNKWKDFEPGDLDIWREFNGFTGPGASFGYVQSLDMNVMLGIGAFTNLRFENLHYGSAAKDGHAHSYFIGIYLVREMTHDVPVNTFCFGALLLMLMIRNKNKC